LQAKRSRLPPLVPEFREVVEVVCACVPDTFIPGFRLKSFFLGIPEGSKLIRRHIKMGDAGSSNELQPAGGKPLHVLIFGVYFSPQEFLDRALKVRHPFLAQPPLPDVILCAVFRVCTRSPEATIRSRASEMKRWLSLAKELEPQDEQLMATLHPSVRAVLKGKRLSLLHKLIVESGYSDKELVSDICKGCDVVGMTKPSGAFEKRVKPPRMSEKDLESASRWTRHSILGSVRSSGDDGMDKDVWKDTKEEEERGWLHPTTSEELDREFPFWSVARRFGLKQKGKNRSIDDYSAPLTNFAYGCSEKVHLMAIDQIVALARLIADVLRGAYVCIKLSDGSELKGKVHTDWKKDSSSSRLLGRLLDLWKAYRSLAFSPAASTARWTNIAVFDPEKKRCAIFKQPVLAFGSTCSVLFFNRVSRCLHFLGCFFFDLWWTNFFDDFPHLEMEVLAMSARTCSEGFITILGWKVANSDNKQLPFAQTFLPLGASIDLSQVFSNGFVTLANKPGRLEDIAEFAADIRKRGSVKVSEIDRLRGMLQFAESFVFGKLARFIFGPFAETIRLKAVSVIPLDEAGMNTLLRLEEQVLKLSPRKVPVTFNPRQFMTFTDGACEGVDFCDVTCGGVVFLEDVRFWFGITVPDQLVERWKLAGGKEQVIAEAELLPILIARHLIEDDFYLKLVIHFVDNDGDVDALIKGFSRVRCIRDMLEIFVEQESSLKLASWIARVPSSSNLGDAPSRLEKPFKDGIDRGTDASLKALDFANSLVSRLTRF
jgi:hypothetical protein